MKGILSKIVFLLIGLLVVSGCSKSDDNLYKDIDVFIQETKLTGFIKTPQGVYIKIENEGGAQKPNIGSNVTIHYKGTLTNGKVFDSSYDRGAPAQFPLANLIRGWQVGIPYFGRGGKGTLIIPPGLGYGSRAQGDIPANSILVFDIELINFQ
jgi:FKBP-type peptidyl-prolyl cis-trans isomerase FkpA